MKVLRQMCGEFFDLEIVCSACCLNDEYSLISCMHKKVLSFTLHLHNSSKRSKVIIFSHVYCGKTNHVSESERSFLNSIEGWKWCGLHVGTAHITV